MFFSVPIKSNLGKLFGVGIKEWEWYTKANKCVLVLIAGNEMRRNSSQQKISYYIPYEMTNDMENGLTKLYDNDMRNNMTNDVTNDMTKWH